MKKVYVAKCRFGRGLFAAVPIARGEPILGFQGPLRSMQEICSRPDSFNMLQVGARVYMDLEAPGVFANHSCEPNAGVKDTTTLIALRDLMVGEEIQYDYSTTMAENLETMRCECGSVLCRRVVRDFQHLSPEAKRFYLARGVVADFVLWQERLRTPAESSRAG